jgi:hypothetical protein
MRARDTQWWIIPLLEGCQCVNLIDAETLSVGLLQVPEDRIESYLDDFDGRSDDFRVFHFPISGDSGIFEAIDSFIAKRFNGGSRVFAAFYGKGMQRHFQRQFKAANSSDSFLRNGCWHVVTPAAAANLYCPSSA